MVDDVALKSRERTQSLMGRSIKEDPAPMSPEDFLPNYINDFINTIRDERASVPVADYYQGVDIDTSEDSFNEQLARNEASQVYGSSKTYYEDGPVKKNSYYDVATRLSNDLMRDFDLTKEQAAGFVGNLAHETGEFKFMQELKPVSGKGGYGFAQWTGDRRKAFEDWARSNDLDPKSYEANYGYLKKELTTKDDIIGSVGVNTIERLKGTDSIEGAAKLVSNYYLRPGIPKINERLSKAKTVFSMLE